MHAPPAGLDDAEAGLEPPAGSDTASSDTAGSDTASSDTAGSDAAAAGMDAAAGLDGAATGGPGARRAPRARHDRGARVLVDPAGVALMAAGIGVCLDGLAVSTARTHFATGLLVYWFAQILPFAVFALLLLRSPLRDGVRQLVVTLVGVLPALYRFMGDTSMFTGFDELLHQRTLNDLVSGSGLFAANPLLSVSPYYPGLEAATGLIVRLTGAPDILAGGLVVIVSRILLVLIIYRAVTLILHSQVRASLAVLFYACSSQFFAFNSQFAYQTLALTLGLGGLFLLRRAQLAPPPSARRLFVSAMLCLAAMTVTHHLTSWIVVAFLGIWILGSATPQRPLILRAFLLSLAMIVAWTAAIASRLAGYLGPIFLAAADEMAAFLHGSQQRQLFTDTSGVPTPPWERVTLVIYAVICTLAALTGGTVLLRNAWRNRNRSLALLGLLNFAFPVTFVGRVAPSAAELGDRASTFLFLPLTFTIAGLIELRWIGPRRVPVPSLRRGQAIVIAVLTGLTYIGGLLLGSGPDWSRLPGPYLASADYRSADAQTQAAVDWAGEHLPAGARIVADRFPADMLGAQTRLFPVVDVSAGADPANLYFAPQWGPPQSGIVRALAIRYLYVDTRLAGQPPHVGNYIHPGEASGDDLLTLPELTKFDQVSGLRPVYRNGSITIYDTTGLGVVPQSSGWTGHRAPLPVGVDVVLGVLAATGIRILRSRRQWWAAFAREASGVGLGVTALALLVFAGITVLGLRLLPGPAMALAALVTTAVLAAVDACRRRRHSGRGRLVLTGSPLVALGVALAVVGGVQAWQSAQSLHVTAVDRILRAAGTGASPPPPTARPSTEHHTPRRPRA